LAEFLETYQEIIKRKKWLKKLAIIYCIGTLLFAIGLYAELGLVPSIIGFIILIAAWIPLKRMVNRVLVKWLREKAVKKTD
jgi:O-antigen ligase